MSNPPTPMPPGPAMGEGFVSRLTGNPFFWVVWVLVIAAIPGIFERLSTLAQP